MRFKKGSEVEVLTKKEVPTGAWRSAEIISGNGHTYSVKFDSFPVAGDVAAVERVPRRAIRPCPPPVNGNADWVSGDVVEVFDELCWKPALIVKVCGGNKFSVQTIGSNRELKAHQYRLRVRQAWEDGNWLVIGRGSSNSTGPLKRKKSSLDVGGQKKRAIGKSSVGGKRLIIRLRYPASEKVDAFVFPKNILGEKFMPSSFHRIDDTISCASSVGSCSGLANDGLKLSPSSVKDFHRSELHAYQQVLQVLFASGPLTWEQEAKVTGLRLSLHISTDEHLRELRKLRHNDKDYLMASVGSIHTLLQKP